MMNTSKLSSNSRNVMRLRFQIGLTLIELLVSLMLGLIVVLAATSLVVSTKTLFTAQTEGKDTQDTARFALDNIAASLRQAGYVNYDFNNSPQITPETASSDISGLDANSVSATSTGIDTPNGSAVNFSDVLAVRYFGSGSGAGDGIVTNCAGFFVPAPVSPSTADQDRGWSIYYVANDANNDPELICKYYNAASGKWSAQSIVKGVESFQVLYGIDRSNPPDGTANQYLTATAVNALDSTLVLSGTTQAEQKQDLNRKTYWKKISVVKVAMLVRGTQNSRIDKQTSQYDLFGSAYAAANGSNDRGTTIMESQLPAGTQNRSRRIYTTTVQVRNLCYVDTDRGTCLPPP
ncbi:PilW family protein [Undibacterium curvum]|uniref:PilW family protein n=1 Tax=Undibacterium curvum TaxID=2762294 RepID=A0ABR7A9U4_9BURK|nr:PilW family protein [Undibacterium curvum]MBC3933622.1 PilW family protein [Undibacterium curvum]